MAGHITKRRRGDTIKWRARYPDPTRGGTAQIERTFPLRKEAERWLRNQQVAVDRGTHIDPTTGGQRVGAVVASWRATWIDLEPKTKAGYESILTKHVLPRWLDAKSGAVSTDAIQEWVNELASKRSPKTVTNIYGVLRSVMQHAITLRTRSDNPCDAVKLPKRSKGKRVMLFLTAREITSLAEAITPRHKLMVYVSAYVGLRAGEVEALRRKDVDLLHSRLNVVLALKEVNTTSKNIADEDKGMIFGSPKNGETRAVAVPRFLHRMFAERLEDEEPPAAQGYPAVDDAGELRWTRDASDPERLLFTSTEGEPIRHDNFYKRHFKPAVKRRACVECAAEVKPDAERCPECSSTEFVYVLPPAKHRLRFHDLRHTCASLLIAANAHPKAIQDHLGHKDIQTTFNVYGHLLPSVHDALGAALDSAYEGSADEGDADQAIPRIGEGAD
jgi:integrase